MSQPYKYFAFISYSRKDSKVAAWLQKRLEWFRFPVKLVPDDRRPPHDRYVRPIYRDKTNLEVTDEHYWTNIRRALEESRYLIVLCSPHSAKSQPVNMEAEHFLATHEGDASLIAPVIVSGDVTSEGEDAALCPALRSVRDADGNLLIDRNLPTMVPDATINEQDAWEAGFVSLVSYLLQLERTALGDHIQRETKRQTNVLRRWLVAVAGLSLCAISAGIYALRQKHEAERQAQVAEEQKRAAQSSEAQAQTAKNTAEGIISSMLGDLRAKLVPIGRIDILDYVSHQAQDYFEKQDKAKLGPAALSNMAEMLSYRGDVLCSTGDLKAAEMAYKEALTIRERLLSADPDSLIRLANVATIWESLGTMAQAGRGDAAGAAMAYEKALTIRRQIMEKEPQNLDVKSSLAASCQKLGDLKREKGDRNGARELHTEALGLLQSISKALPADARPVESEALSHLALAAIAAEALNWTEASTSVDKAIGMLVVNLKKHPSDPQNKWTLAHAYFRRGSIARDRGDLKAARTAYEQALILQRDIVQADPTNMQKQNALSATYLAIGAAAFQLGDLKAARQTLGQGVYWARRTALNGKFDTVAQRGLVHNLVTLGDAASKDGDSKAALESYREAGEIASRLVTDDDSNIDGLIAFFTASGRYSVAVFQAGDHAKVKKLNEYAVRLLGRILLEEQSTRFSQWNMLVLMSLLQAQLANEVKDYSVAHVAFQQTVSIQEKLCAQEPAKPEHWKQLVDALVGMGTAAMKAKDYPVAVADFQRLRNLGLQFLSDSSQREEVRGLTLAKGCQQLVTAQAKLPKPPSIAERRKLLLEGQAPLAKQHELGTLPERSIFVLALMESELANYDYQSKVYAKAAERQKKAVGMIKSRSEDGKKVRAGLSTTLSWYLLLNKDPGSAKDAAQKALDGDGENPGFALNFAHCLLLLGQQAEAEAIHFKYKDAKIDESPWSSVAAKDFSELRAAGIDHPGMKRVEEILQVKAKAAEQ